MKKIIHVCFFILICFALNALTQIPASVLISIVKAEDELRFDKVLEDLMKNADAKIRARAALAAGRIGDEQAISGLTRLLQTDKAAEVRTMAIFALGEIESTKAADAILQILKTAENPDSLRARAVEASGKIAAANAKDEKAKLLGEAILDVLENEDRRAGKQNRETVLLGLTAALRARPEETDFIVAKFLTNLDARVRADAANTLSRVRAKNANEKLRAMLLSDNDAVARANAARALGAAEDKDSFNVLMESALSDDDSRVRVSAIRSLGSLKEAKAADKLLERGENLLKAYKKEFYAVAPSEKNELLEIAATLGRILPNSGNEKSLNFLSNFGTKDSYNSPEIHVAIARISPSNFLNIKLPEFICSVNYARLTPSCWQFYSGQAQGISELANLPVNNSGRAKAVELLREQLKSDKKYEFATDRIVERAIPDRLRVLVNFKTDDSAETLKDFINYNDLIVRATAAELAGDLDANKENISALTDAFANTKNDKMNDAALAILDALEKQYKKLPAGDATGTLILKTFETALDSPDYLVRRKTVGILKSLQLTESVPRSFQIVRFPANNNAPGEFRTVRADYARAVARKNGTVKAVFTTEKGNFTIDLTPEDAPLTVDNFIRLAKSNYFNGLAVHRVVPNFVMQDGDPRGDGNGGPGWQIRCEINMLPFERGSIGMALSGKDTGGSQWFAAHSPQPHLDGGYTVFGRVNEIDMKIVDTIVRGDKILTVKIVENVSREGAKTQRKR
jgi:cyclophilin family peptidyl-prolyl cis-trans isomerase/HEAT repeat protein